MALEYIVPRVAVDESDVGAQPTAAVSLATIGIVGTFSRGKVNEATTVGNLEQLVNIFGEYKSGLTGYLSALGALNQGANDIKIVRIGGSTIASATKTFKDGQSPTPQDSVIVTAKTPGTWGNDITVAVATGTQANTFKLVVVYLSQSETFDNLTLLNVGNISSQFITAVKATGATQIPANISSTPLVGGNDGTVTTDEDYVGTVDGSGNRSGLKVFDAVKCAIILCAQQSTVAIRSALIAHCAAATLAQGLRVAVLNTPAGQSVSQAVAITATLDSMRAILVYPWLEPQESVGSYIAPDGYYAGRLSMLAAQQSPSNKQIAGILSCESLFTEAEIKDLTLAKISPINLVVGRGFRIRNGVNLATNVAWNQTSIRRAFDQLEMEVYDGLQWAVGNENTPNLRLAAAAQMDALLFNKKMKREIYDYKPAVCDDTNNTPETIAARILNVQVRVRPMYAADYVDVAVQRLLSV
jgi:hypothetical protein